MLLERRQFLVKERVAVLKLTDTYDILDPESGQTIGLARDEPPGWAKYARLLAKKFLLPTTIHVYETEGGPPVLSLRKGPAFLRANVTVVDAQGMILGRLRSKLFTLGGGFFVRDPAGSPVAEVKGDWKGWNFKFLDSARRELGVVTKKWAGLGKELFTSADTYMISLAEETAADQRTAGLLLAAGLAIDLVFKERN